VTGVSSCCGVTGMASCGVSGQTGRSEVVQNISPQQDSTPGPSSPISTALSSLHIITRCLLTHISSRDQADRSTQNAMNSCILYMFRPVVSAIFRKNGNNVNWKA
jgi:hypothetical protein